MGPTIAAYQRTGKYFDTLNSGANLLAAFQCVSFLTSTQVAAQSGAVAGVAMTHATAYNDGSVGPQRVVGISTASAKHGRECQLQWLGVAQVMAGAAVAFGAHLRPTVVEQRNNSQTPLINLFEANIPVEPGVGVTYNLSMVDDPAVAAGAGNDKIYPVGWANQAATAKYQVIRVELDLGVLYV